MGGTRRDCNLSCCDPARRCRLDDWPWRAGNTDFAFLREWGPAIAVGVVTAQLAASHLRGGLIIGVLALFTLIAAIRFAAPAGSGR